MFGFMRQTEHSGGYKPRLASSADIARAFEEQSSVLKWLAEVITGDATAAEQCVARARSASETSGVFCDWVGHWARFATIQQSLERVAGEIELASRQYMDVRCAHGGHAPLSDAAFESLRDICPRELTIELDPFARAVLLLRSVQRCTVQDCALRMGTARSAVIGACCALDQWFHARAARASAA